MRSGTNFTNHQPRGLGQLRALRQIGKKPRDSRYPPINVKSPLISHSIKAIQDLNVNWDPDDPGKCQASFISKPADVWAFVIEVIEVRA